MSEPESVVTFDGRTLTIDGVKFSKEFFQMFTKPRNVLFRVYKDKDGTTTVQEVDPLTGRDRL
jgi:hypothetical protein